MRQNGVKACSAAFGLVLQVAACAGATSSPCAAGPHEPSKAFPGTLPIAGADTLRGISGITRALAPEPVPSSSAPADTAFWIIAEQQRQITPLRYSATGEFRVESGIPMVGLPAELDTESITVIDDKTWAIGTESKHSRHADLIFFMALQPDGSATVQPEKTLKMQYSPWNVTPNPNHGIEGLCRAGDTLVAGNENITTTHVDGREQRYALVATYALDAQSWRYFRVPLTSSSGKLSGMDCSRSDDGAIEITAIERHFEVVRLLSFALPADAPNDSEVHTVELTSFLDLAPTHGTKFNPEGIARIDDTRWLIVNDNDYGGISGPTAAHIVERR